MLHAVTTGAYYPPVDTTWKNFDYRSILVDSGSIVQCYNSKCVSHNQKLRAFSFFGQGTQIRRRDIFSRGMSSV